MTSAPPTSRAYFRAAGRSLEAVRKWQKEVKEYSQELDSLREEVGAESVYTFSDYRGIAGFKFPEGQVPDGWKHDQKDGTWLPKRDRKARKELSDRIAAIRGPSFEEAMGNKELMVVGNRWFSTGMEELSDGQVIISVPLNGDGEPFYQPEDAVRLKTSDYYALKGD